jgi:hypothetical protein
MIDRYVKEQTTYKASSIDETFRLEIFRKWNNDGARPIYVEKGEAILNKGAVIFSPNGSYQLMPHDGPGWIDFQKRDEAERVAKALSKEMNMPYDVILNRTTIILEKIELNLLDA